jgi:hypothetical protein
MGRWYALAAQSAVKGDLDLDNGMFWQLHTSSYTPNLYTNQFQSDLTNELATGSGYTAGTASTGSIAAGTPTIAVTVANSWTVSRAASTAYAIDDVVRPASANGFLYRATSAGTTGAGLPTYPTVLGQTVADGGVTWEMVGSAIMVINFADPVWPSAFTATGIRYAVLIDKTSGVAATNPLVALIDFGSNQSGGGGSWTIVQHTALRTLHAFIP